MYTYPEYNRLTSSSMCSIPMESIYLSIYSNTQLVHNKLHTSLAATLILAGVSLGTGCNGPSLRDILLDEVDFQGNSFCTLSLSFSLASRTSL